MTFYEDVFFSSTCLDKECSICLMDFTDNEKITFLPSCKHNFHEDCIKEWFKIQLSCPKCRKEIMDLFYFIEYGFNMINHDDQSGFESDADSI